jgi:hypothetical protein
MKFYHTTFSEYLNQQSRMNLHPELEYPPNLHKATNIPSNLILYGPSGVGKYSQCLKYIMPYSPSGLHHYKKLKYVKDKFSFMYRISDIHYEIDMASLGCNAKTVWHEIFQQCIDIITVQSHKSGIFVCKNFHSIHIDLLDIFYSYMQTLFDMTSLNIKFILLTEHISFIPTIILDNVKIVPVKRPRCDLYAKIPRITGKIPQQLCHIQNIKELYFVTDWDAYTSKRLIQAVSLPILTALNLNGSVQQGKKNVQSKADATKASATATKATATKATATKVDMTKFSYIQFRDLLYDILVYNLEVADCLWYIMGVIKSKRTPEQISTILDKTFMFFRYYNNNYRPIFHLEYMFLSL